MELALLIPIFFHVSASLNASTCDIIMSNNLFVKFEKIVKASNFRQKKVSCPRVCLLEHYEFFVEKLVVVKIKMGIKGS